MEWVATVPTGTWAVIMLFGGMMLWFIVYEIAARWQKVKCSEHVTLLKQQMIEKGFTADEIVRVIESQPDE